MKYLLSGKIYSANIQLILTVGGILQSTTTAWLDKLTVSIRERSVRFELRFEDEADCVARYAIIRGIENFVANCQAGSKLSRGWCIHDGSDISVPTAQEVSYQGTTYAVNRCANLYTESKVNEEDTEMTESIIDIPFTVVV